MNELPQAGVTGSSGLANHENESDDKCYSAHGQQRDTGRFGCEQRSDDGQESE